MFGTELANVARKWAALTKRYLQQSSDVQNPVACVFPRVVETLAAVIVVAGFEADLPSAANTITSNIAEQIVVVLGLALKLNVDIGQKIVSRTIEVIAPSPETQYDAETMVDAYEGGPKESNAVVFCTTEIGLASSRDTEEQVLIKPKVALDTLFRSQASTRPTGLSITGRQA